MSERVPKRVGFTVPDDETVVAWINAQDSIKTSLLILIKWHLARCKGPVDVLEDVFSRMEDEVFLSPVKEKPKTKADKPEKVSVTDKTERTDKSEKTDKKPEKLEQKPERVEEREQIETVPKPTPVVKTVVPSDDVLKDLSDGSDSLTDMSALFGH
jgi:hypothetical protein